MGRTTFTSANRRICCSCSVLVTVDCGASSSSIIAGEDVEGPSSLSNREDADGDETGGGEARGTD